MKLKVVGIADGHHALFTRAGVDLSHYKEELAEKGMPSSTQVSVSYTHLDVYKRQVIRVSPFVIIIIAYGEV